MKSLLLLLACAVLALGCLAPVAEAQCSTTADCMSGLTCIDFRCRASDGGTSAGGGDGGTVGGGSAMGGGSAGGSTMAGGSAGGSTMAGGSAGGSTMAGGTAGGGSADGGAACGCRTAAGMCQPGDSQFACGTAGGQCSLCQMGEQCVNGACVMAACGPGTCAGCCGPGGFCSTPSMQTAFNCGAGGSMCTTCPMGLDCINGTCQPAQPCGPMSCASGCCALGRCVPPSQQADFVCGTGGSMCQTCQNGTSCQNGTCQPRLLMDGGIAPVLPAGSACNARSNCDGFCIPESQFGQSSGYPGGYCSSQCGSAQTCTSGVCITEQTMFGPASSCRSSCPAPGAGQSTCRTGYICAVSTTSGTTQGYCRPNCNNGGLAACPAGRQCQANGSCM